MVEEQKINEQPQTDTVDDEIKNKLATLDQEVEQLEQQQTVIDEENTELEARIAELAKEEALLQKRKNELFKHANELGQKKQSLLNAFRAIQDTRNQLVGRLDEEEYKREQEKSQTLQLTPPVLLKHDDFSNRRNSPRIATAVDVSMYSQHNFYMGLTENLSEGGLFIATYDDIPVNTEIDVSIQLPDQSPIQVKGVVRWQREYSEFTESMAPGVGIQFTTLEEADKKKIKSFLRNREPILYEDF